jgi:hypothetical protein
MAEPARQLEDGNTPGHADSAPPGRAKLEVLEGGSETSEPDRSWYKGDKKEIGRDNLADMENSQGESSNAEDVQHEDQVGGGYKSSKNKGQQKSRRSDWWRLSRRQRVAGGGVVGTIIALVFGFSVFQGPLEFVHIAQTLQHAHFSASQDQSDDRFTKLSRYIRFKSSGQVERTRLGIFQNKVADRIEVRMNDVGVKSSYTDRFGFGDGYIIDPAKLSSSDFEDFKGKSDAEVQKYFKDTFNVDIKTKLPNGNVAPKGTFFVDSNNLGYFQNRKLVSTFLKTAKFSKVSSSVSARIMGKRAGITWHPITRLRDKGLKAVEKKVAWRKERTQVMEEGSLDVTAYSNPNDPDHPGNANSDTDSARSVLADGEDANSALNEGDDKAFDKLKGSLSTKLAASSLAATGILCVMRGLDQQSAQTKEAQVVLPLMREGTEAMALGNQVMSGQDLDTEHLGYYKSLLNGKNSSWVQAQSIQAELGHTPSGNTGKPNKTLTTINDFSPFHFLMEGVAGGALSLACSAGGQALQITIGFLGGGVETQIIQLAVGQIVGGPLLDEAAHWLAGAAIDPNAAGADYGNAINFGSRLAANAQAVTAGGRKLSDNEEARLTNFENNVYRQDFEDHGVAYQLFNPYDQRSAISKVIDNTSPNPSQNIAKMGSIFSNFSHIFSSFPKLLGNSAHAAQAVKYDYGFPLYGFSQDEMNNTEVNNPYKNADDVVNNVLPAHNQGNDDINYIQRASDCFGVTIDSSTYDVTSFGAQPINSANPDPSQQNFYTNDDPHKCTDGSIGWLKTRFYIFDTQTMASTACYLGDSDDPDAQQACADIGFDETQASTPTDEQASGQNGDLPTGAAKQLAAQLLPYIKDGKIFCGPLAGGSGGADCPDIQNTAKGTPIGGNCAVDSLSPHILGLILGLVANDGWSVGISAMCSDHHSEGDGPYGGHSYGSVADFSVQIKDGKRSSGAAAAANKEFIDDAAALLSKTGGSFGQINCSPTSAHASVKNDKFTTFGDSCNHQHIRAAP